MTSHDISPMYISREPRGTVEVLTVDGVLDTTTYRMVRDSIIKAALDEPAAVVVDINALQVPAPSAYAVFTSASWQVSRWPEVPIMLVCSDPAKRNALSRNGVRRYLTVHADVESTVGAVHDKVKQRARRRARTELPAMAFSKQLARDFVTDCLLDWSHQDQIALATTIVTELVDNVLTHTESCPAVRVESDGALVTIAVADDSVQPASIPEAASTKRPLTGLQLVAGLSRAWGNAPTVTGKTVWATIEPEGQDF